MWGKLRLLKENVDRVRGKRIYRLLQYHPAVCIFLAYSIPATCTYTCKYIVKYMYIQVRVLYRYPSIIYVQVQVCPPMT